MDPHYEQRLRDEVIYLHSLWHQGPPTPHPQTNPHLQPSSSTHFKKTQKSKKYKSQQLPPPEDSGIEWPCRPITDPSPAGPSGWPVFTKTQPNSEPPLPPSSQQQAWLIANQSQFKALKAVNEFFSSMNSDSDGDDEDELMDDEEEEEGENEGSESGFFSKLFEEDGELREFYVKNCEDGEFSCLVCSGVGKSKKFKDCVALVQHTITIAKTKKKKAHRAYGEVICKVLGWEIDKLPSIVSQISEKRNALLIKSGKNKEEAQANSDNASKDLANHVVDNVDTVKDNNNEVKDNYDEEIRGMECIDAKRLADNVDIVKDISDEEIRGMESIDAEKLLDDGNNAVDNGDSVKDNKDEEIREKESIGAEQLPDNGESALSESAQFVSNPNERAEDLSKGVAEGMQDNTESTLDTMGPRKEEGDRKEDEDIQNSKAAVDDLKESEIQN